MFVLHCLQSKNIEVADSVSAAFHLVLLSVELYK